MTNILWAIAVILIIGWIFGLVSGRTLGGFIWLLLVLAIVAVLLNLLGVFT